MWRCLAVLVSVALALSAPADTLRIKNLKVLCVIYRGDPAAKDHMDDHAVTQAKNGCALGRLFYFRNSRAQLNCEQHFLVFDQAPPKTEGPTMEHIEAHLRSQGVKPGEWDGVFVTGVDLAGNFGGFTILDGAGGCYGGHSVRGNLEWYPQDDPDVAYGTAWNFVHEFEHALDLVICENSGRKDMLHDHPYADRNEPYFKGCYLGGEHFDWVAVCLREFDGYMDIKGVTNSFLECQDADGDGMPDDDPRLPIDEKRFGSDPSKKDTDGDGLDDLHEFIADRYAGSDPRNPDTDGDGLKDGEDPYPLVAIRPTMAYGPGSRAQGSNGAREEERGALLLDSVFVRNDVGGKCAVHASWNEAGLRLWFIGPRKFVVHMKLDGSADNGFWEGGDTYLMRLADGSAKFDGLGLKGDVPGATVKSAPPHEGDEYVLQVDIPAKIGQGVSKEINYGGPRDPQDVVDGLTLVDGRSIAFNFNYEFEGHKRALLTPLHTMYATRLVKPADAPEVVLLRGPAETNAAVPVASVLAARPSSRVEVVTEDERVVGARIGPGPVLLVGLTADGSYKLMARTPQAKSEPIPLTVKRTVAPPALAVAGGKLTAHCEPGAAFELWWGVAGTPVSPIGGTKADNGGTASFPVSAELEKGWVVTGYRGSRFVQKVYTDAWDKIDRNFQGDAPDPRLPNDEFSYRFEGYLEIPTAGQYTFELSSDDGSRLWIDDELTVDHWGHHGMSSRSATVALGPGPHRARIDYYEEDGWAGVKFRYAPPGGKLTVDVPVQRIPLPLAEVEFFGVQTDRLGNRSGFTPAVRAAAAGKD